LGINQRNKKEGGRLKRKDGEKEKGEEER